MRCGSKAAYLRGFMLLLQLHTVAAQIVPYLIPDFVPQPPHPPPAYMVDNTGNTYGTAPDHSGVNGPAVEVEFIAAVGNTTLLGKRAAPTFWVDGVTHGKSPYVSQSGYKVYRNVMVSHFSIALGVKQGAQLIHLQIGRTMEPKETVLPTIQKQSIMPLLTVTDVAKNADRPRPSGLLFTFHLERIWYQHQSFNITIRNLLAMQTHSQLSKLYRISKELLSLIQTCIF
jgi:hypothetical protein